MTAVNDAEAFVHALCRQSFLFLWSFENPAGLKPNKELCDALIVLGDDVVVISVKDRRIKPSGDPEVDAGRWYRYAIEGSIKQLRGAVRALDRMEKVTRRDNPEVQLPLPSPETRRVHLVAVALGGEDLVPPVPERHDVGLVHVFDAPTFDTLLRELDTATDLLHYLAAKEQFLERSSVVLEGTECDLLAMYLRDGRAFPDEVDGLLLSEGLWDQLQDDPAYQRRNEANAASRSWDQLIEEFAGHIVGGTILGNAPTSHSERGLRWMARENRFHRRVLGHAFIDFLRSAAAGRAQSRVVPAESGVIYVFLACPRSTPIDLRQDRMYGYAAVVLDTYPECQAVVVILTERPDGDWRNSFALYSVEPPITDELREAAQRAREIGILRTVTRRATTLHEYPEEHP